MEVAESEWISKAIDNVDLYLDRGGPGKGDEPQLLGHSDLLNTIGMAMGLDIQDPSQWSQEELNNALNNKHTYFTGTAREAIDIIADQIKSVCSGDQTNFVTVLPIELYYEGKLYEVPLFKVHRYSSTPKYYVDNIGRSYDSVQDWLNNNKLPPCKIVYPYDLKLQLRPGYTYSRVLVTETPATRPESKAVEVVDVIAAVTGIGASVGLIFATGGLAAPFVAAGVGSAIWGTARAGQQLIDKGTHGESVDPFTNAEARMLWLGIAANVMSFGAIGASMRIAAMAARGQAISNALRVSVNIINGTNVAVSGVAIVDTTIYLVEHYKELKTSDILLHIASVAFWTKGVFTYKTVGTIIKETQNAAFTKIGNQLSEEQSTQLTALRTQLQNDQVLLQEYHRATKAGISQTGFSEILIDSHAQGEFRLDGAGNLVLAGGHSFSIEFLSSLPRAIRIQCFDILASLTPEQTETFKQFRQVVNNDVFLFVGIHAIGTRLNLSLREATVQIINFWQRYTSLNSHSIQDIRFVDNSLVVATAPPIRISQLPQLSAPMIRFLGEHLSRMDLATSRQWSSSSIEVLTGLESHGLFTASRVTRIAPSGRAVVLLDDQLQISIYKLNTIPADDCQTIFTLVGQLPRTTTASNLPRDLLKLCVQKYRLRFECQRTECVQWMTRCVENLNSLGRLVHPNLQSFEQDRLYTFKATVDTFKATPYMNEMMTFVAGMEPRNISEMVAYGEFAVQYVETQKLMIQQQLKDGTLVLPRNTKKADWMRTQASEIAFRDVNAMKNKFNELLTTVRNNNMVGVERVSENLSDADLVAAIRARDIKFGSEVSAAYHIYKHPTDPADVYVTRANESIRGSLDRYATTLTQDGDARTIRFEDANGASIILERDGRVLLCTFTPKKS